MAKKAELLKRMKTVRAAAKRLAKFRWIAAVEDGIEPEAVYGPYATQEEFVAGLVEALEIHHGEGDMFFILSFDKGTPEMTSFSGGFIDAARRQANNDEMTEEDRQTLYE